MSMSDFGNKRRPSYGRPGPPDPGPHYRTGRETFDLIRLLSTQAVVISTTMTVPFQSLWLGKCNRRAGVPERKPCFHYGQAVCLKPSHVESPCLPEYPPHVSLSWALPQAFASWGILLRQGIRPGRLLLPTAERAHDGFPRSECPFDVTLGWCFTPVSIRVVTVHQCTARPGHSPFWVLPISHLASSA